MKAAAVQEVEQRSPSTRKAIKWRWTDSASALRRHVRRAIRENLTSRQREAMEMHLDGMTGVATAKKMRVTKVTVHWLVKRARRRIATYIAARRLPLPHFWVGTVDRLDLPASQPSRKRRGRRGGQKTGR